MPTQVSGHHEDRITMASTHDWKYGTPTADNDERDLAMKKALAIIGIVLAGLVLLTYAAYSIAENRPAAGIAAVEALGGTVEIKRVSSMFGLKYTVCWVAFEPTGFDVRRLDEFIHAMKQIGVRDNRITLNGATLKESQKRQLFDALSGNVHLRCKIIPDGYGNSGPRTELTWTGASDLSNVPASRQAGQMTSILIENRSPRTVRLSWMRINRKLEACGKLKPGQTREHFSYAGHTWMVSDETGKPLGYFIAGEHASSRGVIPEDLRAPSAQPDAR